MVKRIWNIKLLGFTIFGTDKDFDDKMRNIKNITVLKKMVSEKVDSLFQYVLGVHNVTHLRCGVSEPDVLSWIVSPFSLLVDC